MTVRLFAGWDFTADDAARATSPRPATPRACRWAPTCPRRRLPASRRRFLVAAMKDAQGGNLDRIQIVKGWVDKAGKPQEKIYNVAWSDAKTRKPGKDGKLPPVGDTVDVANATWSNTIGAGELVGVWKDPAFDPALRAVLLRARDRDPDAALDRLRRLPLRHQDAARGAHEAPGTRLDLAGLVHAGLMSPEQDVNSRWKPDPARILPALVAWIAAAALVLPMADTKAQGASAGTEGESMRVTGSVSYRERVALAPGSLVIVTLEDTSRAEHRRDDTRGGQDHHRAQPGAHSLRDRSRGRPHRTPASPCRSGPHPRPARSLALDLDAGLSGPDWRAPQLGRDTGRVGPGLGHGLGCGTAAPANPDLHLRRRRVPLAAWAPVRWNSSCPIERCVLPQVPAASGAQYQEGSSLFWSQGNEARIEVEGKVYPACTRRPG